MEFLKLAIKSGIPLIHVKTDDLLNVAELLSAIAGEKVAPLQIPEKIGDVSALKIPKGRVFYTSTDCTSLQKLYQYLVEVEKVVIFINTQKSVLHFEGGQLVAPKELVRSRLEPITEEPDDLIPAFAGTNLKDMMEIAQMTMTRDSNLTTRGINETRRHYNNLRGIQPVDTFIPFYMCPSILNEWLEDNAKFFIENISSALTPKGLLFSGPPGTGKTLASKYIANAFGVPLYRLDLGAMMGKFVGESEASLTAALNQIDQVSPSIIILDEVEKVFQAQGDSGVTSRLLSQLLWWMNEKTSRSFVVMTTNDIAKIPPELYREGRIDYVMDFQGISDEEEAIDFTSRALDALAKTIPMEVLASHRAQIGKSVKTLLAETSYVAQVRLNGLAQTIIKKAIKNG